MAAVLRRNEVDPSKLAFLEQIDQVTDSAAQLTRALLGFEPKVPLEAGLKATLEDFRARVSVRG